MGLAHGELDSGYFVHAVVWAITSHFWFAYDQPVEDGYRRMSFYSAIFRAVYWLFEYVSISRFLTRQILTLVAP